MPDAPGSATAALLPAELSTSGCATTPEVVPPLAPRNPGGPQGRTSGGPFTLGQNYPNPHGGETTVPFTLTALADIRLIIFDHLGRKVAGVVRKARRPGPQSIKLNLTGLGLPPGTYAYELQVATRHGVHQQSKQMTTE